MWLRLQQLWQPGKVRCDPSRFIFAEQLRRRPPPGLILEIDVGGHVLSFFQAEHVFDGIQNGRVEVFVAIYATLVKSSAAPNVTAINSRSRSTYSHARIEHRQGSFS